MALPLCACDIEGGENEGRQLLLLQNYRSKLCLRFVFASIQNSKL
jgi:hypothetical protein